MNVDYSKGMSAWEIWFECRNDFSIKRCTVRLYLQSFVGGRMSYLRFFCVCLLMVVSNPYCVVCLLCFSTSCVPYVVSFSGLSFCIAPSVFANVYLHCTVHTLCDNFNAIAFWPLRLIQNTWCFFFSSKLLPSFLCRNLEGILFNLSALVNTIVDILDI